MTKMPHETLVRQVLLHTPMRMLLRGQPRTRWRVNISDLAWSRLGVEPAELSEVAENRDVFRDLELLLPAILIRGMRV